MANILISGGAGLIGRALSSFLKKQGHNVSILSRNKNKCDKDFFYWNPAKGEIENEALLDVDVLINLAGANIAEKRWTEYRKKEILESRLTPLKFLYEKFKLTNNAPKTVISASGAGFYGNHSSEKIFTEKDEAGTDFLAQVCKKWEDEADKFHNLGSRIVKLRIGAVLSKEGGALKKMLPLFNLGLGSAIGSGKQTFPYIHINDLVSVINKIVINENIKGTFNCVADDFISNFDFSKQLAESLQKPFFLPNVPAFFLRILLGDLSEMILTGNKISNKKLKDNGIRLQYGTIQKALNELF